MTELSNHAAPVSTSEDAMGTVDPVWTSSRTARQIHALSAVEKVRFSMKVRLSNELTALHLAGH